MLIFETEIYFSIAIKVRQSNQIRSFDATGGS